MKRSKHSLSHYRLTSLNMGRLVPVACEEVLPGDSFRHSVSALIRCAPLVAPVMHPVHVCVHSWFVPSRLLWNGWEAFITGREQVTPVPTVALNKTHAQSWALAQRLGIGVDAIATDVIVNALPFRAYNFIWNEFYRDEALNAALPRPVGATGDVKEYYFEQAVSWEKDYFTTCRAYPQQGAATEVTAISLTGSAFVKGLGIDAAAPASLAGVSMKESDGVTRTPTKMWRAQTANTLIVEESATAGVPNIRADLSTIAAGAVKMDINEWRRSMAMQRMREHRNRFGDRYRDYLASLGIEGGDARLDRPEYLGGGRQTIAFSEVLSTAETTDAVVGDMAGHGIAAMRTNPYRKFFPEHGYVMTMLFVRPVSVYMNRVPRHFLRRTWDQYWQKELEAMGEQAVTNFEVYGDAPAPSGTFGYIPRYDEYRHGESSIAGEFRSTLDYWHMARDFTAQPVLNGTFVGCDPTTRIFASATTDQLYAMIGHRIVARRLVSKRARN